MTTIYYTYYTPVSSKILEVAAQEGRLGLRLLVHGLEYLYGIHISEENIKMQLSREEHGKPRLTDHPRIHFNITHCPGLVACAFDSGPIGVDAELPGYFPPILIKRALAETEKDILTAKGTTPELKQEWFYRLWTLKEAYVKKSGQGVDTDLTAFFFSFAGEGENITVFCSDPLVSCYQTRLEQGHILSLCSEKAESPKETPPSLVMCELA